MPDFREIPGSYAVPGSYMEVHDLPAADRVSDMPLRVIIVGQTNQQFENNILHENVTVPQVENIYGRSAIMTQAVRAFMAENPNLPVDTIGILTPGDARAATATIKFTGSSWRNMTSGVYIGGIRVSWTVSSGDTPSTVATNLLTAINASLIGENLGITAQIGNGGDNIVLTAGEAGQLTNDFNVRFSSATVDQIPGMGVLVNSMAGGTGTPDMSPAILSLGDRWYTDVVLLQNDPAAVTLFAQEAKRRSGAMVARDMRVHVGMIGTQGQALNLQGSVSTSENVILFPWWFPKASSWQMVSALAAQVAQSLNTDPARQLRGLPLNTLAGLGPEKQDDFSDQQKNVLLNNGCSTAVVNDDGTVTLQRVVTTRTINPASGTLSGVWDVMIPAIAARVRYEWNTYIEATYFRSKLADDGSPLANADGVVTPKTLKGSWAGQCKLYEALGWIDDVAITAPQAVFQRDLSDRNRVNSTLPIKPMGSLMVLANILNMEV
ncbi:phage tail protein [Saccharibacter sp. 17.LH.SD]|uniref:phage tail protein n=1 Tax=Saccharibacter sp. 17.LH.SD TaxID=2689393 RepID=UPI00136F9962|nr:phage tail protein [Saccharibacter sp. 17.LH.SD]MXV43907.1 phage tail protein [Saccharibacter sp. 17.LH.SD]